MRILHVDYGKDMRGGQHQVLYLLKGLRELGHEVRLVCRGGSPLAVLAAEAAVEVAGGFQSIMRLAGWADCVHAHDARSHTLCMPLRKPLVVSRRVIFPVHDSAISRWKYSRPILFLAVSRAVAEVLERAKVPKEKVRIVYDGVPVPADPGEQSLQEWLDQRPLIVAPASNDSAKGSDLVRGAAEATGLPVLFSSDLPADLPRARCMIYLSRAEGLGSAALLAMAHGVPVIASQLGGLTELVRHGDTGYLTPNAPRLIAGAMRRMAESPATAHEMGKRARKLVESEFSIPRLVERTLNAYREAAASREVAAASREVAQTSREVDQK